MTELISGIWTERDLRALFSLVLQDTWLFSGSIYENIRYGRLDARKDEVIDAAKMANIHHYIPTLSHGYDSMINEEANNISQGEKAASHNRKSYLKKPEDSDSRRSYIISRHPSGTDAPGRNAESHEGRTSFVIAHRLSTIRNADLILVD